MGPKKHTLAIATGLSGSALALGATLWVQATAMQNQPLQPQPVRLQPALRPVDPHYPSIDLNAPRHSPISPSQPAPSPNLDLNKPNETPVTEPVSTIPRST